MRPHNLPFVALGAGLLWFGWFGFNAGCALTVDGTTGIAFINTQVATGRRAVGWVVVEWIRHGKPTLVGVSSGAVAGLVAITPACGFVAPVPAVLHRPRRRCGLRPRGRPEVQARLRRLARRGRRPLRRRLVGSLAIGFFATDSVNAGITDAKILNASNGLFYGGGATQLLRQFEASALVPTSTSFAVALVLALILKAVKLGRVSEGVRDRWHRHRRPR